MNKDQPVNISTFKFFNRTRYVILVLSIISLALIVSNNIVLNFTIICMKKTSFITKTNNKMNTTLMVSVIH